MVIDQSHPVQTECHADIGRRRNHHRFRQRRRTQEGEEMHRDGINCRRKRRENQFPGGRHIFPEPFRATAGLSQFAFQFRRIVSSFRQNQPAMRLASGNHRLERTVPACPRHRGNILEPFVQTHGFRR
ncbi:hypothetical protein SDC9_106979 [bioreactor metagenome]|uniref:Uncharacterized protein n=1 Tax=bioreactor metagenome TaxID=1076179 RepID=A0A645B3V8_9ZZZZ